MHSCVICLLEGRSLSTERFRGIRTTCTARNLSLLEQILRGEADANISFSEMLGLLKRMGFQERIKGSHHIFWREGVNEILNLQADGNKCNPYQVKQVRKVIINYGLARQSDD